MIPETTERKVKVLLFGPLEAESDGLLIVNKLRTLHFSKAGPFHIAFILGSTASKLQECLINCLRNAASNLPFPTYVHDTTALNVTSSETAAIDVNHVSMQSPCLRIANNLFLLRDKDETLGTVAKAGIWEIPIPDLSSDSISKVSLVVVACPPRFRMDSLSKFVANLSSDSYIGCDFLLSVEWPQGIEKLISGFENSAISNISSDVADVAMKARSKYHLAASTVTTNFEFRQSPAFYHLSAATHTKSGTVPSGRFISLSPVNSSKDKAKKYVHAVGIVPFQSIDLKQDPGSTLNVVPCPFTDESYSPSGTVDFARSMESQSTRFSDHNPLQNRNAGLSAASAQRILNEERKQQGKVDSRWSSSKRKRDEMNVSGVDSVDPTNVTLFVHGLQKDVTGRLQQCNDPASDQRIINAILKNSPSTSIDDILNVRRPSSSSVSSFCFVEFKSHTAASISLDQCGGVLVVDGVPLQLKWGTHTSNTKRDSARVNNKEINNRQRLTEREAHDSLTLYFKFAPSSSKVEDFDFSLACEGLRVWMEQTLEDALLGEEEAERVTADVEPALQVKLRVPLTVKNQNSTEDFPTDNQGKNDSQPLSLGDTSNRNFGFLDFASHAAASLALATLTGSTDGGRLDGEIPVIRMPLATLQPISTNANETITVCEQNDDKEEKVTPQPAIADEINPINQASILKKCFEHIQVYLHWAKKPVEKKPINAENHRGQNLSYYIEDGESGFKFQRKHFPADSRKDCWFCLASQSCEKHLIVGVYETCYSAMPKGPIHPGHILLIPVQHTDCGIWNHGDKSVASEIRSLIEQMRKHADSTYNNDLFVFERAIPTRGLYHSHVQCIPIAKNLGPKIRSTMLLQAAKSGFDLVQISSELSMDSILAPEGNESDDEADTPDKNKKEYFYAEIPTGTLGEYMRFLYRATQSNGPKKAGIVPLQFGREVLAAVIGNPDLAHWKSCIVDRQKEESMVLSLRASLNKCSQSDT